MAIPIYSALPYASESRGRGPGIRHNRTAPLSFTWRTTHYLHFIRHHNDRLATLNIDHASVSERKNIELIEESNHAYLNITGSFSTVMAQHPGH